MVARRAGKWPSILVSPCRPSIAGFRELHVFDRLCLAWSRPALTAAQIARARQIIDGDGRSVKKVDACLAPTARPRIAPLARTSTSEAMCVNIFTY